MPRTDQTTLIDEQIMAVLADGKPRSRDEILEEVKLPRSTVYYSLLRLMHLRKVECWPDMNRQIGRPRTLFCIFIGE